MTYSTCIVALCYAFLIEAGHPEKKLEPRRAVCVDVAKEADSQGVDPLLAISVANVEGGFRRRIKSSAGALGPMQVIPRFWCKKTPCDLIKAGVYALRTYTKLYGESEGLCRYVSGRRCSGAKSRQRYRDKVLRFKKMAADIHMRICVNGC